MAVVDNVFFGNPNNQRLKAVAITFEAIAGMCQMDGTRAIAMKGWPKDAEIVGATLDEETKTLRLVLTHPAFPALGAGEMPPDLPVDSSYTQVG